MSKTPKTNQPKVQLTFVSGAHKLLKSLPVSELDIRVCTVKKLLMNTEYIEDISFLCAFNSCDGLVQARLGQT